MADVDWWSSSSDSSLPLSQIPGYVTLLNQLLAFTPPDHVERVKFEEARSKLQELSVVSFTIFPQTSRGLLLVLDGALKLHNVETLQYVHPLFIPLVV